MPNSLPVQPLCLARWARARALCPGLIPVGIDASRQRIIWRDIGRYHFYESFFHRSLEMAQTLALTVPMQFETGLDVLEDDRVANDAVPLAGLIFHAGRCRSTLLARALARSRENLVLSEPAILGAMLLVAAERAGSATARDVRRFRNLVLALSRHRVPAHKRSFIKFTSHDVASFGLIRSAFPEVPAIFLTRNSAEIVRSFSRAPPGWAATFGDVEAVVRRTMKAAAAAQDLPHVDHDEVKASNLASLIGRFDYAPAPEQLEVMQTQFAFDSKEDFRQKPYDREAADRNTAD